MGWSCTDRAGRVRKKVEELCILDTGMTNTWTKDGRRFFFEVGRENADGSITGTVNELIDYDGAKKIARRRGGFKIDWDGELVRFSHLTPSMRAHAREVADAEVAFSKGALFYAAI